MRATTESQIFVRGRCMIIATSLVYVSGRVKRMTKYLLAKVSIRFSMKTFFTSIDLFLRRPGFA